MTNSLESSITYAQRTIVLATKATEALNGNTKFNYIYFTNVAKKYV